MSFSGKKWKRAKVENMLELFDALKIREKVEGSFKDSNNVHTFIKNSDGTLTYKIESGANVVQELKIALGEEVEQPSLLGTNLKNIYTLEGDTLKQVTKGPDGKNMYLVRSFSGNTMTMKVTADGADITGIVEYQAV